MSVKIDGVVERYGPSLCGHGDHGFNLLFKGSVTVYWFNGARQSYSDVHGRKSDAMSAIVELTAHGDHVSFEVARHPKNNEMEMKALDRSLRNWTLEQRLIVSPRPVISDLEADGNRVGEDGRSSRQRCVSGTASGKRPKQENELSYD